MPALLLPSGVPRNPVMRPRERADPQLPCGEVGGGQRRRMRETVGDRLADCRQE